MYTLFLNIFFSSSITLSLKYADSKDTHSQSITVINYFIASISGFIIFCLKGGLSLNLSFTDYLATIIIACFTGTLYLLTFKLMIITVSTSGAGMSILWNKSSVLIPIAFSLIFLKEQPDFLACIGVTLTLISIFLVSYSGGKIVANKALVAMMLCSGIASVSLKLFQICVTPSLNDFFVFCVFTVSFLLAFMDIKKTGGFVKKTENFAIGSVIGVCNVLSDIFLMVALTLLPATFVYPISSAGTICFIPLVSALLFKEKLTAKQITALALTVTGIVLINI